MTLDRGPRRDRDVRTRKIYGPPSSLPGAPSETMQALDETTLALGRATKALGADDGRQDASLARRRRRRQVLVEESGLRARASPVRQGGDLDDLLAAWKRDAHEISRPKGARRLDGLVIDVDFAAGARGGGECPALEEASSPEPLVHSEIRHDALTVTRAVGYTRRGDSSVGARHPNPGGHGETMRRGTIVAVVLLAAASAVWGQGAQLVVEDWSKTPAGTPFWPTGWKAQNWGS